MKTKARIISQPIARIDIGREPLVGYKIISGSGPSFERVKPHVFSVLDVLGQPDPSGPQTFHRWVGPVGPQNDFVGVKTTFLPNGDAVFEQEWFGNNRKPINRLAITFLVLALMSLSGLAGFFSHGSLSNKNDQDQKKLGNLDSGNADQGDQFEPNHPPVGEQNPGMVIINQEALPKLMAKLDEFFLKKGFLPPVGGFREIKPSARITANFPFPPYPDYIELNNIEVELLIAVLKNFIQVNGHNGKGQHNGR